MHRHSTLANLRTILATLYPIVDDSRRVAIDAGLDPLHIAFDAKAITNWQHILEEALRCHRIDELLKIAYKEYPEQVDLIYVEQVCRIPGRQLPRLSFEPETVLLPAGPFWMSGAPNAINEYPCHQVMLLAYQISHTPISNAQYAAFVQDTGNAKYRPQGCGWRFTIPPAEGLHQAVTMIRWSDALAYCAWLQAQNGQNYQLPSEAEWEKAAQAGIITGTLREWTTTIWGDEASFASFTPPYQADGRDSLTAQGVFRIWRSCERAGQKGRGFANPVTRLGDLGFRVVLALEPA